MEINPHCLWINVLRMISQSCPDVKYHQGIYRDCPIIVLMRDEIMDLLYENNGYFS